jgi:hypothetical protein
VEKLSRLRSALAATLVLLAASLATLAFAEGILRVLPRFARSASLPDYGDTVRADGLGPGGLLKEGFEGSLTDGRGGRIFWKNNAAGFRSREETPRTPAPGAFRVLSMGDSFTAGYRVDQEATFSRVLEKSLRAGGIPAEVLIAEIEQPSTGLWWLLHGGFDWRPAIVLLGVTLGNDVAQTFFSVDPPGDYRIEVRAGRAAVERLKGATPLPDRPEYALQLPPSSLLPGAPETLAPARRPLRLLDLLLGPLPQPITPSRGASSPRFLVDGVNGLGICLKDLPPPIVAAFDRLERTLSAYAAATRERGAGFLAILFPQRYQVQPEDWEATVRAYGLSPAAFDLGAPGRRLAAFCAANGIDCLDLSGPLREEHARSGRSLYLPGGDMHWNATGHAAAAAAILPKLRDTARIRTP